MRVVFDGCVGEGLERRREDGEDFGSDVLLVRINTRTFDGSHTWGAKYVYEIRQLLRIAALCFKRDVVVRRLGDCNPAAGLGLSTSSIFDGGFRCASSNERRGQAVSENGVVGLVEISRSVHVVVVVSLKRLHLEGTILKRTEYYSS